MMKKLWVLIMAVSLMLWNSGVDVQAAGLAARSGGHYVSEIYSTTDAYGDLCVVHFQYKYSDGVSVIRTSFNYSNNNKTWSTNVSDSYAGDRLYSTATLTCVYSFSAKAWCDIYGDHGHVY